MARCKLRFVSRAPAMEDDLNTQFALAGLNPFDDPLDRILAEIALSIQLPPSLHDKAKSRYDAVRRHLEGTAEFRDQIEHFYPQIDGDRRHDLDAGDR
jgi:hypothetical protein